MCNACFLRRAKPTTQPNIVSTLLPPSNADFDMCNTCFLNPAIPRHEHPLQVRPAVHAVRAMHGVHGVHAVDQRRSSLPEQPKKHATAT